MKTKYFFLAAIGAMTLASCSNDELVGDNSPTLGQEGDGSIQFTYNLPNATRAGEFIGATAAEKLGGMFVVEGTKGKEEGPAATPPSANSPSTTVVFDNYLVGYEYNSAGRSEDNTNNWEYVGLENGITGKLDGTTWRNLHPAASGAAESQTIKYWDYSATQYDFIAWSTGNREAVTTAPTKNSSIQVTRINTGSTLATNGFTMTALSANDLMECYYTDINTVTKASGNYGKPVTLTFRNMAAKVRVGLYETVPGYSVKDVKFYSAESDKASTTTIYDPEDLGTGSSDANAVLFTTGTDKLPLSGEVLVYYPHIGTDNRDASPQTMDYNKASVTVSDAAEGDKTDKLEFGALTNQYSDRQSKEVVDGALLADQTLNAAQADLVNAALSKTYGEGDKISSADAVEYNATLAGKEKKYLGRTLPTATFAGDATKSFYTAVIPNTDGKTLTLRVDYTLVPIDGAAETIKVYGAKAVVPSTYTVWQPNYAYTYIFKISDNSNGWTSTDSGDPAGLYPITFDAVVTSFTDVNAEQTTVTTVATPSITTYQQGHDWKNKDEYSMSQKKGVSSDVKDLYVQVMDNSTKTPSLKGDLNDPGKSLLFSVNKANASEAEVMDALQNRTNEPTGEGTKASYKAASPVGRNGITLTTNSNISNIETRIVNGVDDQPITDIAGSAITAGQVAKIDIDLLEAGTTYAYVYCTPPTSEKKVYHVVSISTDAEAENYYEVSFDGTETAIADNDEEAEDGKVYFIENLDANGNSFSPKSFTFKQTKIGDKVKGLYKKTINTNKANNYTPGNFYFDVYYQNNGEYAVKVIKVVS